VEAAAAKEPRHAVHVAAPAAAAERAEEARGEDAPTRGGLPEEVSGSAAGSSAGAEAGPIPAGGVDRRSSVESGSSRGSSRRSAGAPAVSAASRWKKVKSMTKQGAFKL